jgi:hypothetical protein
MMTREPLKLCKVLMHFSIRAYLRFICFSFSHVLGFGIVEMLGICNGSEQFMEAWNPAWPS